MKINNLILDNIFQILINKNHYKNINYLPTTLTGVVGR